MDRFLIGFILLFATIFIARAINKKALNKLDQEKKAMKSRDSSMQQYIHQIVTEIEEAAQSLDWPFIQNEVSISDWVTDEGEEAAYKNPNGNFFNYF